ncbi:MAG: hypothetical protein MJE77_11675 [Proteobacteria bacterium]|nr:hypothetical protein [Pseudomonadota bacterium]
MTWAVLTHNRRHEAGRSHRRIRLIRRACDITNADWRKAFLYSVADHARTLELARLWREESR